MRVSTLDDVEGQMLIPQEEIRQILRPFHINIAGVLHVGAHDCEELPFYESLGVRRQDIIWIEANPRKVEECRRRGIPNVYQAVISNKDNEAITFHIASNGQSSSMLELGSHQQHHPDVTYVDSLSLMTTTLDTFLAQGGIDASRLEFWNLDIQGAELMALQGATRALRFARALYLEVNAEEVYKHCGLMHEIDDFLAEYGFKRVRTEMTGWGWGDALYIAERFTAAPGRF
jgi:FkbM family methyltransferase